MPLNDYVPAYRDVKGADGRELGTVRGLSLHDIQALVHEYLNSADELANVVSKMAESGSLMENLGDTAISGYLLQAVQDAPGLVIGMIMRGGDLDADKENMVRQMPMGVQVILLERIFDATFEEAGGVKKFWSALAKIVTRLKPSDSAGRPISES